MIIEKEITQVTRRNIYDSIIESKIYMYGRLDEPNFLGRLFDLANLPSTDPIYDNAYRDIVQHRVLNPQDWDDSWILSDPRINFLHCDDAIFLQFLCDTIHPIVRNDSTEINKLLQIYNTNLQEDGYKIVEKTKVSGKPVFAAIKLSCKVFILLYSLSNAFMASIY